MIDYIKHYQETWRSHVNRMSAGRFLKTILRYRPMGGKIDRTSNEEVEGKLKTVTGLKA
jgi:hypothetical protein